MAASRPAARALALVAAGAAGFTAAALVPRSRWRQRPSPLPAGPWPPMEPLGPPDPDSTAAVEG